MNQRTRALILSLCTSAMLVSSAGQLCLAQQNPAVQNQDVCAQALQLAYEGKEQDAKNLLLQASKSQSQNPDVFYFLAAAEARESNFDEAIKYLRQVTKLDTGTANTNGVQQVLVSKRLADCLFKNHNLKEALEHYSAALFIANQLSSASPIIKEEILEGIVACQLEQKNYTEAEKNGLTLLAQTKQRLNGDPTAIMSVLWSLFQLSDLYRLSNQQDKLATLRSQLRPLVESLVNMQMQTASVNTEQVYENLMVQLRQHYVKEMQPTSAAEVAWAATDFRERTLPIIGWHSAVGRPKASILCVHGLGLENKAFAATAQLLNKRGYEVYALDVRGFGAWSQTKGLEELDYEQTTADIGTIANAIKEKTGNIPLFVLGESMGGALALRAAADLGKQIDGVISSVPSAERFQQRKMTLQTTLHFFMGPKKAFDVGYVAAMATSNEKAQEEWKEDPKARLRLSPVELAEFAVFMRRTKPQCEKITTLPVLVVQGLADKLVKPAGTFELFDAVSSPDKTLYLAGLSEHLMFENEHPDGILIDTVDSWIGHHLNSQQMPQSQQINQIQL